jgi:catechol 2,3-dioxygenase-like lactoylglutathione lyase family enzyme
MAEPANPRWRGINHLALITPDMDATVRFWHGVLGASLVGTLATPEFRHYFFRIGDASSVAFFEYADADVPRVDKVAGIFDPRSPHLDHVSLNLPDDADLLRLQRRLREAGCEVTEMIDHIVVHSIYFTDPNGIALEASCWLIDTTTAPVDYAGPLFADAHPVAAVRELHKSGALSSLPTTRLAGVAAGGL